MKVPSNKFFDLMNRDSRIKPEKVTQESLNLKK